MAGSEFTLTCNITETISGLTNMPTAIWRNIDDELVTPGDDINIEMSTLETAATSVLIFDPLKASHGKVYRCVGSLISAAQEESVQVTREQILTTYCKRLDKCLLVFTCVQ